MPRAISRTVAAIDPAAAHDWAPLRRPGPSARLTVALALLTAAFTLAGCASEGAARGEAPPQPPPAATANAQAPGDEFDSLNAQVVAAFNQGRRDDALALARRALALAEQDHPGAKRHATALNNLGSLLQARGDLAGAEPLYRDALAMRQRLFQGDHPDVALSLNNLGYLVKARGDLAGAEALYRDALAMYKRLFQGDHPDVALSLNNLGSLLQARGDLAGAEPLYREALAMGERVLGAAHPDTGSRATNLALTRLDLGHDLDQLWADLSPIRAAERALFLRVLEAQTERSRFEFAVKRLWRVEADLSIAAGAGEGVAAEAYERVLGWEGQIGRLSGAARSRLAASLTAEQRRLLDELQGVQGRLSSLTYNPPERLEAVERILAELQERRERLERELNRTLERSEDHSPASFAELADALPPDAAAIDFFIHSVYEPALLDDEGRVVRRGGWSEDQVSAWVTRRGAAAPVWVRLGSANALEDAVRAFLFELTTTRAAVRDVPDGAPLNSRMNDNLYERLWAPLAPHLEGAKRVIVSPDRFLGTLPLDTLQGPDGAFLLERYAISYQHDLSSLPAMLEREPERSYNSLLAMGGVNYDDLAPPPEAPRPSTPSEQPPITQLAMADDGDRGGFGVWWDFLQGTVTEVNRINGLHERHYPAGTRKLVEGPKANEERMKSELESYAVLHLATHGYFEIGGVESIWDGIRGRNREDRQALGLTAGVLTGRNPGLLSGLVCAGANLVFDRPGDDRSGAGTRTPERDDGYLTAEEIGWLDLSKAELVVLSACQTGLGESTSGEGMIGLRRTILVAGARTVVSSLWNVRDHSTSQLMQMFYANLWRHNMSPHAALREAQLQMLESNRRLHNRRPLPSTWGAFVLDGDWR